MSEIYTISLAKIIKELSLEVIVMPGDPEDILVSSRDVNRPGVELGGYIEAFDNTRINVIGRGEANMLANTLTCMQLSELWCSSVEGLCPRDC